MNNTYIGFGPEGPTPALRSRIELELDLYCIDGNPSCTVMRIGSVGSIALCDVSTCLSCLSFAEARAVLSTAEARKP